MILLYPSFYFSIPPSIFLLRFYLFLYSTLYCIIRLFSLLLLSLLLLSFLFGFYSTCYSSSIFLFVLRLSRRRIKNCCINPVADSLFCSDNMQCPYRYVLNISKSTAAVLSFIENDFQKTRLMCPITDGVTSSRLVVN